MGGRGSGGGKNGGGGSAAKKVPTGEGMNKNELINLYNSISGDTNYTVEQRVKIMHDIEEKIREIDIKNYKKSDKIKYINQKGGANIDISDSYSSKEIDRMFKAVQKGKKMKKVGYEWIIDHKS